MLLREYLIRLHLCKGVGIATERKILNYIKMNHAVPSSVGLSQLLKIERAEAIQLNKRIVSNETTEKMNMSLKISDCLTIVDENYPQKLKEIYNPPLVLFYRGDITLLDSPLLGVVGARQNSVYANQVLEKIIPEIVDANIVTISGLAQGIDSICHRITLNNGGKTIGVIGTGINMNYPKINEQLQNEMMKNHLVITEYAAFEKPLSFHFPQRNRIIAGLCDSLLVVEAKEKSGSLITANIALEENRNVLVVPGRVDAELSRGCNLLFREGAKPVLDSSDILEEFAHDLTK